MTICVHGLGYIGLTTAALFANNGHEVVGYDTDPAVRRRLQRGEPDLTEADLTAYVERALEDGLTVSDDPVPADVHVICVPTPYDHEADEPDLNCVVQAGHAVRAQLRRGDTVVLESTVPPGTTAGTLASVLANSGLDPGEDFALAYVPETVMPGNTVAELRSNDRILGGVTVDSAAAARALYGPVTGGTVHVAPDATTAEFVKLAQNAFRDVNIAFANTLALVAGDYGVDVRTAIELANSHPRVDVLDPGPGVGGHCLPVDPLFLGQASDKTDLVEAARWVNDRMPGYVATRLERALGSLSDRTIAVLGVAYKGNVDDTRHSPGLALARHLRGERQETLARADGGWSDTEVRLTDPHVTDDDLDLVPLPEALRGADAAVITAAHDEFADLSPEWVGDRLARRVVVDTLDVLSTERWERHGFQVVEL